MERQLDTPDSASITVVSVTVIFSTCSPGRLSLRVSTTRSWRLRNGDKRHQSGCLLPGIIPAARGPPEGPPRAPPKGGLLMWLSFLGFVCLFVFWFLVHPLKGPASYLSVLLWLLEITSCFGVSLLVLCCRYWGGKKGKITGKGKNL